MKTILVSLLLTFLMPPPVSVLDFSAQLKQVLVSSKNDFSNLKGQKSVDASGETIYKSTIELEGTKENSIGSSGGKTYYKAVLSASKSEPQVKKALGAWKEKMEVSLGKSYSLSPFRSYDKKTLREGYVFSNEQHYLSVYWMNADGSDSYQVVLVVASKK